MAPKKKGRIGGSQAAINTIERAIKNKQTPYLEFVVEAFGLSAFCVQISWAPRSQITGAAIAKHGPMGLSVVAQASQIKNCICRSFKQGFKSV